MNGERALHRTAFAKAHWSVSSLFVSQITREAFGLDLADVGGGGAEFAADFGAGGIGPDDGLGMEEGGGVDGFMGFGEGGVPLALFAGGAGQGPREEGVKPRPFAGQG